MQKTHCRAPAEKQSRRKRDKITKAAMTKHRASLQMSRIKKVRLARGIVRRKFRAAELPQPSTKKLKQLVAKVLNATGDPPRQVKRQSVSLGHGMQQIMDRMRAEHNKKLDE